MHDRRRFDRRSGGGPNRRDRAGVLFRKHLALLPGYPPDPATPVAWRPFGRPGQGAVVPLSGPRMQRIEATIVKLEREHFRGLAEIVADPVEWLRRARFLLDQFKRAVHDGTALGINRWLAADLLPGRLAASLGRFRAGLGASRDLFDSLLFMEVTGPGRPAVDLVGWFELHRDALERMSAEPGAIPSGVADAARILFLIRADLPEAFQSTLLGILAEPAAWRVLRDHPVHRKHLQSRIGEDVDESAPWTTAGDGPTCGEVMVGLPARLLELPADRRAAIAALLDVVMPDRVVECIRAVAFHQQRSAGTIVDRIRTLGRLPSHQRKALRKQSRAESDGLVSSAPGEHAVVRLLHAVEARPYWSATAAQVDGLRQLLARFPGEHTGMRPGLLGRWMIWIELDRPFAEKAALICRLFARRGVHASILAALTSLLQTRSGDDPISELFSFPPAVVPLFERMVYDAGWYPTEAIVSGLAAIVDAFGGGDRAESIARRLGPGKVAACDCSTLEPIARLTLSAEEVPPLVVVAGDATSCAALRTLAEHLVDPAARALAIRVGIRGEGHLLQRWAEVIRMTRAVGLALPCHAGIPADAMHCPPWAGRYPAELHGVLSRLAAASDDAERMAAAAAGRLFTDRGALQTEAAAIDAALARPLPEETRARLLTRRDRLLARAEGREAPRPGTVAKVLAALERRADEFTIRQAIRAGRDLLRPRLTEMSGGVEVDDRVFDPPLGDPLAGVLGLSGRVRSAGLRLLLERAGGMALDTLAAPVNRGFIERMTAKGIDVGPWLDGRVEIRATTVPGEEFVVRFSDDVLDVLLMGHHFQTCLSPGDVNFFSAVTNAVDVNKRVAYGRTREGRIVGRRLLALTDDGLLKTFAAYSHADDDRFAAATDAFARDLAAAMGTFLTAQGSVSPLVLSQWYDDGAASIEGDRSFEAAEGLLSKTLHAAEPERVVEEVSKLLGGRDRLRDHLTRILVLPALRSRPDLLPPLADAFGVDAEVPVATRVAMAMACHREGHLPRADRLLEAIPASTVVATLATGCCRSCWAFHSFDVSLEAVLTWLAAVRPALASHLLHRIAALARSDQRWRRNRRDLDIALARYRAVAWGTAGR